MAALALVLGTLIVAFIGLFHRQALLLVDRLTGPDDVAPGRTVSAIFVGLLLVHTAEVLLFAGVYALCLRLDDFGGFTGAFSGHWSDLVYFSFVNFTTLGYTQIVAAGPMRLLGATEALCGFMVLTWSATFIYSAWQGRPPAEGQHTWGRSPGD